MTKIFKWLRQSIISENKYIKYIFYALGEIVLVVIGILIALSINNWNEDKKDSIKEVQILNQLKDEYNSNLLQLEQKVLLRESIIRASREIIGFVDNPLKINSDSLISRIAVLINDPTFDPINNDLINSGNLRLIKNERLKQLLANWPSDIVALQEIEKIWQTSTQEVVVPFCTRLGISRDVVYYFSTNASASTWRLDKMKNNKSYLEKSKALVTTRKIIENKELEGIVSVAILYNESANLQSHTLHKRIVHILDVLTKEIHNKVKS